VAKLSQVGIGLRKYAEIDDKPNPAMPPECEGGVCLPDPNQMYGYSKYGGSMEPYGNPVYEGTGYPAAGFGERRRKAVPLAKGQFKFNPQTREYEPAQKFTVDKVNVRSDSYNPAVASFQGLSEYSVPPPGGAIIPLATMRGLGYPAVTYPEGKATLYGLRGLGLVSEAEMADFRALISEVVNETKRQLDIVKANEASVSTASSDVKAKLRDANEKLTVALRTANDAVTSGFFRGSPLESGSISDIKKSLAYWLRTYAEAVREYNKGGLAAWAGTAADVLVGLAKKLWSAATFLPRLLMWGAIGVGAVFVLPPLLKIILAGRRGGVDAAIEQTVQTAEGAQNIVKSGATLVARGAAAAASGGQSELALRASGAAKALNGVRSRRSRKSRRTR